MNVMISVSGAISEITVNVYIKHMYMYIIYRHHLILVRLNV